MKRLVLAAAIVSTFAAGGTVAFAQTAAPAAAPAPTPDWTFTGNAGLFSDYRFRGFTQTGYKPAYQGGFDVAHVSGFYAGNWNSNVEQGLYNGASLEMDLYAGYKASIGDFGYDVGYLYYYYPNSGSGGATKIKNGELYVAGSYGPVTAKYSYATTDFFSLTNSKGSWYFDLSGVYDFGGGWGGNAHWGYQKVKNGTGAGLPSNHVADYKIGVTKDISGWSVGASFIGTSRKDFFTTAPATDARPAGKTSLVVSLSKTF